MQIRVIRDFLRLESSSGIILFVMAVVALILSNSPFATIYQTFFQEPITFHLASIEINKPLLFWINEGLMTIFFLLVGLELKREFIQGELSTGSQIVFPIIAAFGGMLVPALIYSVFNYGDAFRLNGWATPVATDIAFALGVLSLFGKRVPFTLKLFLMALAIFDDVGAILIIAIFHTHSVFYLPLLAAVLLIVCMVLLNIAGVRRAVLYLLLGIPLWFCILKSGVHATITGVVLALVMPQKNDDLENQLHPWVAYLVMPLFALANAGVSVSGLTWSVMTDSVVLGIALGLFLGKQLGVMIFSWIAVQLRWVSMPKDVRWWELYGVALLCGIGFTMSLFLGTLAFQGSDALLVEVRVGVLTGSVLSGITGSVVLYFSLRNGKNKIESQ